MEMMQKQLDDTLEEINSKKLQRRVLQQEIEILVKKQSQLQYHIQNPYLCAMKKIQLPMEVISVVMEYCSMDYCGSCGDIFLKQLGCIICAKTNANNTPLVYESANDVQIPSVKKEDYGFYRDEPSCDFPTDFANIVFTSCDQEMQDYVLQNIHNTLNVTVEVKPNEKKGFMFELSYGNDGMGWLTWQADLIIYK